MDVRRSSRFLNYMAILLASPAACAYELVTHGLITDKAFERSVLNQNNPNNVLATLGLNRLEPTGIFDSSVGPSVPDFIPARRYYDDRSSTFPTTSVFDWLRKTQPQENGVIQALAERGYMPNGFSEDTIVGALNGWMVRGAVREDDNDALIFSVGGFEYNRRSRRRSPRTYDPGHQTLL